jgi:dUTP pyrophosphatase
MTEEAKVPTYARAGDAGLDVYAIEEMDIKPGETIIAKTGIKVVVPRGYELQVRPKSGRSAKSKLRVANAPGTIDSGYRDEIGIILENIEPAIVDITYDFVDGKPVINSILHGTTIHIGKGEKIA